MRIAQGLDELSLKGVILAIGNFDGVHLGHRMLLERMRELSGPRNAAVVLSFFPPAKVVLGKASFLSSAEEKVALLSEFEPTAVVLVPFSREYALTEKGVFVDQVRRLAPEAIIVGEDFRFGHERAGGLNDLSPIAGRLEAFGLKTVGDEVVKSSRIRESMRSGDIARANHLLGRPYSADGVVLRGEQRGRTIGFPTANLDVDPRKALPIGVFAVTVDAPTGSVGGMANVGPRPSFPDDPPSLEVNLFDFTGDLYDATLTVRFHAFLRAQRRFESLDELKAQLAQDERAARTVLAARG